MFISPPKYNSQEKTCISTFTKQIYRTLRSRKKKTNIP